MRSDYGSQRELLSVHGVWVYERLQLKQAGYGWVKLLYVASKIRTVKGSRMKATAFVFCSKVISTLENPGQIIRADNHQTNDQNLY